jgi:outer membrane protein OmpA-like peptidoglycan-associated protein
MAAALQVFPLAARADEASALPTVDSALPDPEPPSGPSDLTDLHESPGDSQAADPPPQDLPPPPDPQIADSEAATPPEMPAVAPAAPAAAAAAPAAVAPAPHRVHLAEDTSALGLEDNITVSDTPLPDDLEGHEGAPAVRRAPRPAHRRGPASSVAGGSAPAGHPHRLNDRDEDGVHDAEDACPEVAGTLKSGCPAQLLARRGAQKIITAPLNFAWGTQIIRENDNSYEIIRQVASVMLSNPKMHVTVVGYTDGLGPRRANLLLARRRAVVVRESLIQHGVELWRLSVAARGPVHFVRTNRTPHGRARNRRVEFLVGQPSGQSRPAAAP